MSLLASFRSLVTAFRMDRQIVSNGLERTKGLRAVLLDPTTAADRRADIRKAPLFDTMTDTETLRAFGAAFDPELRRLRRAHCPVEHSPTPSKGAYGDCSDLSPSQLLYGADYPEINRTLLGMLVLKWIVRGEYDSFTAGQSASLKLPREKFESLRRLFFETLSLPRDVYALLVATVVNDIGKDPDLEKEMAEAFPSPTRRNHDEVIHVAAQNHLLPLVEEFSGIPLEKLLLGLALGAKLNCGQLAQAENVPGSLATAIMMRPMPHAFDMKFLEIVLDVAGAQGHNDSTTSKTWVRPTNEAYLTSRSTIMRVINGEGSLRECYDGILISRASLLEDAGFLPLEIEVPEQRALLRLMTMGRVVKPEIAELFKKALDHLRDHADPILGYRRKEPDQPDGSYKREENKRTTKGKGSIDEEVITDVYQALVEGLSVDGIDDGVAIIPYYAPGLFSEALRVVRDGCEDVRIQALSTMMRLVARALRGSKPAKGEKGAVLECDLSFAQKTISGDNMLRGKRFADDPTVLDDLAFPNDAFYEIDARLREQFLSSA